MSLIGAGALCLGLVIGWVTYRTLRRKKGNAAISDIAAVIGAVSGGAITGLFHQEELFAWYAIGLAIGFFVYFITGFIIGLANESGADAWMIDEESD